MSPTIALLVCGMFGVGFAPAAAPRGARAEEPARVYFGTYTEGTRSEGIYTATFDPATGALGEATLAAKTVNPSFLALHPTEDLLFAVNEVNAIDGREEGAVSAFRISGRDGTLEFLNRVGSSGTTPCHLSVYPSGRALLVANYGSGDVAPIPIEASGKLALPGMSFRPVGKSVNPQRQEGPHAHCARFDPSGRWALAADLGVDRVHTFDTRTAPTGITFPMKSALSAAPGAGPRHLAFHPGGRFVFVNNELDSTLTACALDGATGEVKAIQTLSTLPEGGHRGNSTAETVVHPSGKFVYVSNRGHDSIAMFAIDQETGSLTALGQQSTLGKTPRNFNVDPSGRFLLAANQESNTVVVFRVDADSGKLEPTGVRIDVPAPVCVMFAR